MATGRLTRALSGITMTPRPSRLPDGRLAPRVQRVRPGSPADRAGVLPGDLIVTAAGLRIRRATDLRRIVRSTRPPYRLRIRLLRSGMIHRVCLAIRPLPGVERAAPATVAPEPLAQATESSADESQAT